MSEGSLHAARVLYFSGRADDAMEALGRHLAAEPDDVDALALSAFLLCDLDRPKEAKRNAERAVSLDPQDVEAWSSLAWTLMRCNLLEKSFEAAEHVIELAPDDWRSHHLMAQVASTNYRRTAEALVAADRAVRIAPDEPAAHITLGNLWLARGRHGAANKEFRAALRLDPQNQLARQNLVRSNLDSGRSDAIRDVVELVAERPTATYPDYVLKLAIGDAVNRIQGVLAVGILLMITVFFGSLGAGFPEGLDLLATRLIAGGLVLAMAAVIALMLRSSRRSLGPRLPAVLDYLRTRDRVAVIWAVIVAISVLAGLVAPLLPPEAFLIAIGVMSTGGVLGWLVQVIRTFLVRAR